MRREYLDIHDRFEQRRFRFFNRRTKRFAARCTETVFVTVNCVIAAVDQSHLKIDQRITGDGTTGSGFDDAFFDGGAKILRNRTAEDLVDPFETGTAFERLKYAFAIAKLSASARLFLMSALNFDLCRDGLFIRNLRRMERDFDVVPLFEFLDDRLNMKLPTAR